MGQHTTKTFFIIRHAEKDPLTGFDPSLSTKGRYRAERLADVFNLQQVDKIYVTKLKRVIETFEPLARRKGIPMAEYDPYEIEKLVAEVFADDSVHSVIIGGHQDTSPIAANILLGKNVYTTFDNEDYDNILIVTSNNADIRERIHLCLTI